MWQRTASARLRRQAGKARGDDLSPEDWTALWTMNHSGSARAMHRLWLSLPASPRCGICGAPFAGAGSIPARALGYRPSRKNPHFCATCVELSPPGGATMTVGVFFADIRGFTSASERTDPAVVAQRLRRFYGAAESVLFPEAIIDKLIGDEVMALYLEAMLPGRDLPALMVDHAAALLGAVGYGSPEGPFVELGVGIDFGEAYVGNIGQDAVYDFTAVGDVVNTASRLQGQALGGQVVVSGRAAAGVPSGLGEKIEVALKGKAEPEVAVRVTHDELSHAGSRASRHGDDHPSSG